ncbi:androgen-induced gene 1 protein [Drosophila bipectinata]|uniref:androgen-induced gene 1 protein n=1 Tax=Drosophila bipectinata TaxID=42026 RepID=UPI001C899256|nr:androgen-induced gene 1 protein [Drosophila bipectinata]
MELRNWAGGAQLARLLLHFAATAHLGYAIYYDYRYAQLPQLAVDLRLEPPIGGKFKYMTFLGGLMQLGYYSLALTFDITRNRTLRPLRDYILASFVVPLSLTVSLTFWTLYAIDREAIYPGILDLVYPRWLNHAMHTFVVVYAMLELGFTRHRYPSRSQGFGGLATFMAGYLIWVHILWFRTSIWVYPFLGALSWPLRLMFFLLVITLGFLYYILGETLNSVRWRRPAIARRWSGSE